MPKGKCCKQKNVQSFCKKKEAVNIHIITTSKNGDKKTC